MRIALVTGASKGIGRQIAHELATRGFHVIVCARGASALKNTVEKLRGAGLSAECIRADVTNPAEVAKMISGIRAKHGYLDVLVNNAGGAGKKALFGKVKASDWIAAYDLNVVSAVRMVQLALPLLRASDNARIINICSLSALISGRFNPEYSAAKAALLNLTKHLSDTLASEGILVNSVSPGPIDYKDDTVKLKRTGTPADVAKCVAFFSDPMNSWVTGTNLRVDGGKARFMS